MKFLFKTTLRLIIYTSLFIVLFTTFYINYFYKHIPIIEEVGKKYLKEDIKESWNGSELKLDIKKINIKNTEIKNIVIYIDFFDIIKNKEIYIKKIFIDKLSLEDAKKIKESPEKDKNTYFFFIKNLKINNFKMKGQEGDILISNLRHGNTLYFDFIINKYIKGNYIQSEKQSNAFISLNTKSKSNTKTILNLFKNKKNYNEIRTFLENIVYGDLVVSFTKNNKNNKNKIYIIGKNVSIKKNKYIKNGLSKIDFNAEYNDNGISGDFIITDEGKITGAFTKTPEDTTIQLEGINNFNIVKNHFPDISILQDINGDFDHKTKIIFDKNSILINTISKENNLNIIAPKPIEISTNINLIINIDKKNKTSKVDIKNGKDKILIELNNKNLKRILVNSNNLNTEHLISIGGKYGEVNIINIIEYFTSDNNVNRVNEGKKLIDIESSLFIEKSFIFNKILNNSQISFSTKSNNISIHTDNLYWTEEENRSGDSQKYDFDEFYTYLQFFKNISFEIKNIENLNNIYLKGNITNYKKYSIYTAKIRKESLSLECSGMIYQNGKITGNCNYLITNIEDFIDKKNVSFSKNGNIFGALNFTSNIYNSLEIVDIFKSLNGSIALNIKDLHIKENQYKEDAVKALNMLNVDNIILKAIKNNDNNGLKLEDTKIDIKISNGKFDTNFDIKNNDIIINNKLKGDLSLNHYKNKVHIILPLTKQGTLIMAVGGLSAPLIGGYYILEKAIGDSINKSLAKDITIEGEIY